MGPGFISVTSVTGRPDPGTTAWFEGQLLHLEARTAVSTVRVVCWKKALCLGWEAHGPLLGFFSLPDAPLTQTRMQRATIASLHPGLLEASPFPHPHPDLESVVTLVPSAMPLSVSSALPINPSAPCSHLGLLDSPEQSLTGFCPAGPTLLPAQPTRFSPGLCPSQSHTQLRVLPSSALGSVQP